MKKKKEILSKQKSNGIKRCVSGSKNRLKDKCEKKECHYDDWVCRVYQECGTKKCELRRKKILSEMEKESKKSGLY